LWIVPESHRCKVTEDFLPAGPRDRTIIYEAPFDRCDREQDYATVWREFAGRAGVPPAKVEEESRAKRSFSQE